MGKFFDLFFENDFPNRTRQAAELREVLQGMFKNLRRSKLKVTPLPVRWRRIIEEYCLFYSKLSKADRSELDGHIQVFLAEKQFEGCGGFEVREEHRVCIVAQACLLLLHRETDYYPRLRSVLIYPAAFMVPVTRHVGHGVMEENRRVHAGLASPEGAVVLSWDDVYRGLTAPENGHNVVLHEFAHQLDFEDGGYANGVPLIGDGESWPERKRRHADWARIMRREFEQLRAQAQHGEATILSQYGATNPAEFFAVTTECFFCRSHDLREKHRELYEQMKWYYKQDPAGWNGNG
jgi:MtfA peptidase